MNILIACECSGKVREAFRLQGHNAWSCDIQDSDDKSDYHIKNDCFVAFESRNWDMVIAFPPCTHLAVSGARHFATKRADGRQQQGIDFFIKMVNLSVNKMAIENPIGIMSNLYRKPDQIIQPWMFGHGETKATCLWLKNLPKLIPTNIVSERDNRVHRGCGYSWNSKECAKARSETYQGIANAMAEQWGKLC